MSVVSIGVDPGQSGSIVCIEVDQKRAVIIDKFRLSEMGQPLNEWCIGKRYIRDTRTFGGVFVEKVSSRTGQGVCAVFTFGWNTGAAVQAVSLIDIPVFVSPQKWQKSFGLVFQNTDGLDANKFKTFRKNQHKQYVLDQFGYELPHAETDAFLIALWGVSQHASFRK